MDWAPRCKGKLDCTAVSMATLCHCFRRVATQTQVNTTFKTTTLKLPVNCWGVTFQEIADLSVMNNNCHIFEQRHKTSIIPLSVQIGSISCIPKGTVGQSTNDVRVGRR